MSLPAQRRNLLQAADAGAVSPPGPVDTPARIGYKRRRRHEFVKRREMFLFVFGLPGGFAQWCDAVTVYMARRAGGSAELIRADTLEQVALSAIGTDAEQAVVSSPQPGGRLRAALADAGRNYIVALDDPRTALIDLVVGQGMELAAAVQALASSCAALAGLATAPGALALRRDRDWQQPGLTAAAIARHLQIPLDDAALGELLAAAPPDETARSLHDAAAWWEERDAAEQQLVIGALAPFIDEGAAPTMLSITWGRDLFFHGDRPDQRANAPVDITGRARCLVHGPHIILPAGDWSLSLSAAFSRAATEHEFAVEISTDRGLVSGTIRPQGEGRAELTLGFALDDAAEHPIAIRISSLRAAFDGAIDIDAVRLVRAAPTATEAAPVGLALVGG